jgi:hypothetical protein
VAGAAVNRGELLAGRVVDGWPDSELDVALREAAASLTVSVDRATLAGECSEVAGRLPELMSVLQGRVACCQRLPAQTRAQAADAATLAGAVALLASAFEIDGLRPADPVLTEPGAEPALSFAALDRPPLRHLVEVLGDESDIPGVVAALEQRLADRDDLPVLVVGAALQQDRLTLAPRVAAQLQLFMMRSLLARNAAESAYRLAAQIEADPERVAALAPGERVRLAMLTARAGRRCGRAALAGSQLAAALARAPADEGLWRESLTIAAAAATPLAMGLCEIALQREGGLDDVDAVTVAEALREAGRAEQAYRVAEGRAAQGAPSADVLLSLANAAITLDAPLLWQAAIERCFAIQELPVAFAGGDPLAFAFADGTPRRATPTPAPTPGVSVIMTAYNAATTIDGAIASVLRQSAQDIDLIVVDDASEDDTCARVAAIAGADARVRLVNRDANHGTYAARNIGLAEAKGTFVTFHDSDDWMHPQRLERHLRAMDGGALLSTSDWFRMDAAGLAVLRPGAGFLHLNPSSLFLRRSELERLGPFEEVRAGADGELLARARALFGPQGVVHLPLGLGIGFQREGSLTASGPAALDRHRYSPVRSAYTEAWVRRHVALAADGER